MFRLVIVDRANKKAKTYAGLIFDGKFSMNLVLSPGVVLSADTQDKYWFNLVPYDSLAQQVSRDQPAGPPAGFIPPDDEGEVPF